MGEGFSENKNEKTDGNNDLPNPVSGKSRRTTLHKVPGEGKRNRDTGFAENKNGQTEKIHDLSTKVNRIGLSRLAR